LEPARSSTSQEALRIIEAAKERKIVLRATGSIAFKLHCPTYGYFQEAFGRKILDIDFVSYHKHASHLSDLFEALGYRENITLTAFGGDRLLFEDKNRALHCDVFLDKMLMNHEINFVNRLEIDYPTVPLADLLLTKLQIVKLNEKDIIDTIMLLREHEVGSKDDGTINVEYIANRCGKDWGLYHTVTINLGKVGAFLPSFSIFSPLDSKDVTLKLQAVTSKVEAHPKGLSWKIRARTGEKMKWYNEVEELYR
jgi:hypothetical protein